MPYIHIYTKQVDEFNTKAIFLSDKQEKRFVEKREKALQDGYELLFDSAKSLEEALAYCELFEVYPDYCVNCGTYTDLGLYRGKRFDGHDSKWRVFNGYLCDMCATDGGDLEVKLISDYKPKLS